MNNATKGIVICVMAYFFAAMIGICVKLMSSSVSLIVVLFCQNFICLLLILPETFKNGIKNLKTNNIMDYAVRIISGAGCSLTLFYLVRTIPISEALLYQYSAPLWIPFIMMVWLSVFMQRKLWYGIVLGFVGVILIIKPNAPQFQLVSLLGILCGIFQGISTISVRKLALVEPTLRILFYNFFFGTFVALPFLFMTDSIVHIKDYLLLIGAGLSTYLAQKYFTTSFKYADAATLAPICYTGIVFSGLFGWIVWHEIPGGITLLGMAFIIGGCLLSTIYGQNKKNHNTEESTYAKSI